MFEYGNKKNMLLVLVDIVNPSDNSRGEDVNEPLLSDDKAHFKDMKAAFFRKTESNELDKNGQLKNYPVFSRTNMHVSTAEHLSCKTIQLRKRAGSPIYWQHII